MASKTLSKTSDIDIGLKNHMIGVYNNMGLGLLISGLVSYLVGTVPALTSFFLGGPQAWLFILAPLVLSIALMFVINKLTVAQAQLMFYAYAALMGISLGSLFLVYKMGSIAQVFVITSATFFATSLYGYTTKRDLSGMGSFLFMGLIGILIAALVNLFLQSSALAFAISVVGVLVFTGLTAYDTQRIKDVYFETFGEERAKSAILGALNLYLDFINLFIHLLQLIGERRE